MEVVVLKEPEWLPTRTAFLDSLRVGGSCLIGNASVKRGFVGPWRMVVTLAVVCRGALFRGRFERESLRFLKSACMLGLARF